MLKILFAALKEIVLAIISKIAFKAVAERFATRLVIHGLQKLTEYSENDVVDATAQDIIVQLQGKRLHVIDNEINKSETQ